MHDPFITGYDGIIFIFCRYHSSPYFCPVISTQIAVHYVRMCLINNVLRLHTAYPINVTSRLPFQPIKIVLILSYDM